MCTRYIYMYSNVYVYITYSMYIIGKICVLGIVIYVRRYGTYVCICTRYIVI